MSDLVIAIAADGFLPTLRNLLQTLAWQTDPAFRVVILSHSLAAGDLLEASGALNLRVVDPGHAFHRSRTRNAVLSLKDLVNDDVVMFTDADALLAPDFVAEVKRAHASFPRLVTYGVRKELTQQETATIPAPVSKEWFAGHVRSPSGYSGWTIRAMFQACRARWLREVDGYPEYMDGWGAEDLGLHLQLVERAACEELVLPRCVALHQWHPPQTDFGQDGRNYRLFLAHRERKLEVGTWFLTNERQGWLICDGDWLIENSTLGGSVPRQVLAMHVESGVRAVLSSLDGTWERAGDGPSLVRTVDPAGGSVTFASEAPRLGGAPGLPVLLAKGVNQYWLRPGKADLATP